MGRVARMKREKKMSSYEEFRFENYAGTVCGFHITLDCEVAFDLFTERILLVHVGTHLVFEHGFDVPGLTSFVGCSMIIDGEPKEYYLKKPIFHLGATASPALLLFRTEPEKVA